MATPPAGLLKHSINAFDQVAVVRPDHEITDEWFIKHLFGNIGKKGIWATEAFGTSFDTFDDNNCPLSVNDQWFTGDSKSVITLLENMPNLAITHKEWEREPGFHKWWQQGNSIKSAHEFFLNAEGILAKSIRWNNLTCHTISSSKASSSPVIRQLATLPKVVKNC